MGNYKMISLDNNMVGYNMNDFIKAVKQFPLLWDRNHEDFHLRNKRDEAWHNVCHKIWSDFSTFSNDEKSQIVEKLVIRWKNTRDCYLRSLRLRSETDGCCIRRYLYEDELRFLTTKNSKNQATKASTKRSASHSHDIELLAAGSVPKKQCDSGDLCQADFDTEFANISLVVDDIVKEFNNSSTTTTVNPVDDALEMKVEIKEATEEIVNELDAATSTEAKAIKQESSKDEITEVDVEQSFFNSIKPLIRTLSDDKKLDFQIEVLKLLKFFRNN